MRIAVFCFLVIPFQALAQNECDLFNIQELAIAYSNLKVDSAVLQPDGSHILHLSNGNTQLVKFGCTDSLFTEYQPTATLNDGTCLTPVVFGCTDPTFTEFSPFANTEDGTCSTPVVEGCTDSTFLEFEAVANTDDGSCTTPVVYGCTDPAFTEYNILANTDDGSCLTPACSSPTMDGYTYAVVEIGDQCWFAENLRTTILSNGAPIEEGGSCWVGITGPRRATPSGFSQRYDSNGNLSWFSNLELFGRYYNWYATVHPGGLCPSGWHVPSHDEFTELKLFITNGAPLNMIPTEGAFDDLASENWGVSLQGQNNTGFSAMPGGLRPPYCSLYPPGGFNFNGKAWWWTSTSSGNNVYGYVLEPPTPTEYMSGSSTYSPYHGMPIRCVKDEN